MKGKGVFGRLLLLTCLFCFATVSPSLAQTPSVGQAEVAKPSPTPAPLKKDVKLPTQALQEADGIESATPAPISSPAVAGTLHLPAASEHAEPGQWKREGEIGQSTFVDKLRTVTWALALICFLIWLFSKIVGKGTLEKLGLPVEPDNLIQILEKKRLSPGRSIMLVRVGPKVLAVAATESGFRTLTEIDGEALKKHQDEAREEVAGAPEVSAPGLGGADIAKHYLSIIPGLGAKK